MIKHLHLIIIAAVLAVTGEVALKKAMNRFGILDMSLNALPQTVLRLAMDPFIVIALVLYVFAVFFWMAALSRVDLNFGYPVFAALGYVLVTLASKWVLHEEIPMSRLVGVIIICVGLFVTARSGQ